MTDDKSFFNEATPELLDSASDWLLVAAKRVQNVAPDKKGHMALCLGAIALAAIAQMRRRESDDVS